MPALRGPQRRTHSRATASVRSPMPPGQQPRNIADTSRSVSDSALLETASMCSAIPGSGRSGWAGPIPPASTRCRRGISPQPGPGASPARGEAPIGPGHCSGGLRDSRDAFLVERHLLRHPIVGEALDDAYVLHDQARVHEGAPKVLAGARGGELLGGAVEARCSRRGLRSDRAARRQTSRCVPLAACARRARSTR